MKWIIKNPAPMDSRLKKWGDYHFGRSLTRYLERAGHEVVTHYQPRWDADEPADVVVLLRGKYPFPPGTGHAGALRVIWNISHPADVTPDEYASHDVICVASRPWAADLGAELNRPVHALLQCTDTEEFNPRAAGGTGRQGVVFIGNTRDEERPGVLWALDHGLPLRMWGRGWQAFDVPDSRIVGDYFPNEDLGSLYASSRATLNDHWPDMKAFGFVNNRVFDALACELPIISDWHEELADLVPEGVLFHRDREAFERCIEAVLLDWPRVHEVVRRAGADVRRRFSFEVRSAELLVLVDDALHERT